jgi:hypothetical protein
MQLVVNPGLGMGKSTFIGFWSVQKAYSERSNIVVILNSDSTLLYRDYSKVNAMVDFLKEKHKGFGFSVKFVENPDIFQSRSFS